VLELVSRTGRFYVSAEHVTSLEVIDWARKRLTTSGPDLKKFPSKTKGKVGGHFKDESMDDWIVRGLDVLLTTAVT
jgi:hypothetical protein